MTKTTGSVNVNCIHTKTLVKISYVGSAQGVLAVNKADTTCFFAENTATASYELIVGLKKGLSKQPCYMDKVSGMDIYTITVQGRLLHKDFEDVNDEEFLIHCNFEPYLSDIKRTAKVIESWSQPDSLGQIKSVATKSKFAVTFARIDGTPFPGSISMGRKMRLMVKMTAAPGDVGFQPIFCKASSTDGKKSLVLLAGGCGVGKPWGFKEGFTTKGKASLSPVFTLFRLVRGQSMVFSCDFRVCKGSCDGSSCHKARRKRWVEENTIVSASTTISPSQTTKHEATLSRFQANTVKEDLQSNQTVDSDPVKHTGDFDEEADDDAGYSLKKDQFPTKSSDLTGDDKPPRDIEQEKTGQHIGTTTGRLTNDKPSAGTKYRLRAEKDIDYKIIINDEDSYKVPTVEVRELNPRNINPATAGIIVDVEKIEAETSIILDIDGDVDDIPEAEIGDSDLSVSRQKNVNDGGKVDNIGNNESTKKIKIVILAVAIVTIISLGFVVLCLKKFRLNLRKEKLSVAT